MASQPLVSIIIPTYNRAHLIGETLDSVLAQTYTHWECLITDDGSTDNTVAVIEDYVAKDGRFKLFTRPKNRIKGANACRNIGLENATGDYIVFFDSDDLMTSDHLEVKIKGISSSGRDYVITKTEFLDPGKQINANNYRFDKFELTPFNYVSQAVNWLTYDICIQRSIAQKVKFNEQLQSGQEYNYFSKLVHISTNYLFVNKTVTLRRYHEDSIRSQLDNKEKLAKAAFNAKWQTYLDLDGIADKKTKLHLLGKCVFLVYENKLKIVTDKYRFTKAIFKEYYWKGIYFVFMILSNTLFDKGHFFYKKLTKNDL